MSKTHTYMSAYVALAFILWSACAKTPEPNPVIFDLEAGVVTTEQFEEVPLALYGREGVTHLMLVPTAEAGTDPALGPLSSNGLAHAVAAGNYAMGFLPEVVMASTAKRANFTATPTASLADLAVMGYDSTSAAGPVAEQIMSEYAGKRVVVVGEPAWLAELAQLVSDGAVSTWPEEGSDAIVFVAVGAEESAVQPFGVNVRRE